MSSRKAKLLKAITAVGFNVPAGTVGGASPMSKGLWLFSLPKSKGGWMLMVDEKNLEFVDGK